jgi:SAM-dependent methyltransferase
MSRALDALTSSTLKHLREQWWNDSFSEFLEETLRPKPGKRILDVGCGTGNAEGALARLRLSQVQLYGVDLVLERLRTAARTVKGMNARVGYAAADACRLPFKDGAFDSTFCVAVLQHIRDVSEALTEFVRVTREGGRIVAVEPDNSARYWFSSVPSGMDAYELGRRFFASVDESSGTPIGPSLPGLFAAQGLHLAAVDLFPVSVSRLGPPPKSVWEARRSAIRAQIEKAPEAARTVGQEYLAAIERYAADAAVAGSSFVEIQNTMLFATVAQKPE